ncbi:putative holin-like toxin, partial [Limosilactobacillus fermentum]
AQKKKHYRALRRRFIPHLSKWGYSRQLWIKGSSRVRKANYWSPFVVLRVFQALTLMLMFGTFVITLLDYIKKHHK